MSDWIEAQIDRIVGPTHHFGGLGIGNVASMEHGGQVSNPAAAARQGLDKMRQVAALGVPQLVLPPQRRPRFELLHSLGFTGPDSEVLMSARKEAPHLLSASMSCSAMWTANAATLTPACDTVLNQSSVTVANLDASLHRSIEHRQTEIDLRQTLPLSVNVNSCLEGGSALRDEGAANHMRLSARAQNGTQGIGIHLFVYGDEQPLPQRYWPRQTIDSVKAVARRHEIRESQVVFLKQHPEAIDAGAFHNDVVAMSHENLLIYHQRSYWEADGQLESLDQQFQALTGQALTRIEVNEQELTLKEAIETYLFNSQIVTARSQDEHRRVIICPAHVKASDRARALVEQWLLDGWFAEVQYVDLGQSMDGGGGPACLRLRAPLRAEDLQALPRNRVWSESLDESLREEIENSYPTRVTLDDLARHEFIELAIEARNRIASILHPG